MWSKKWHPSNSRQEYETTFAIQKWKDLSEDEQQKHTLEKCKACERRHHDLQMSFPQGPHYQGEKIISINKEELDSIGKKQGARKALCEINTSFSEVFNTSFTDSIVRCGDSDLRKKASKAESKKKLRNVYRKCRDQENEALKRSAAIATLTEDESMRSYQRKRKRQYFEPTPESKRPKTTKSHSPNFNNVTWDKEKVLNDLQLLPSAPPPLNWQQFAREHGISGGNAGQIAKEFAKASGVDTERLDGKSETQRPRVRRRRLLGGEISVPSTPTPGVVKNEWKKLIDDGEISLGRPCIPYNMVRYATKDGELEKKELTIVGRKFPLLQIRQDLLSKHEKYMRLTTNADIESMSYSDLSSTLSQYNYKVSTETLTELQRVVKAFQRTRSLILWHDHGTILGLGCIILTVHIAYDPAVFLSQPEYEAKFGKSASIQSIIERPVLHLMAAGSSAVEDQLALLQDRIDCLSELTINIVSTNNIEITDKLRFFVGDHPAQQFERGTQHGGYFKCCGCSVRSSMMGDLAHTLHLPWRSLQDQQDLVLKGKFGKQPCSSKPLDSLRVAELRQELHARAIYDTDHCKDELQETLTNILGGIQRVPTLLLLNPTQALSQLNLDEYTILDCEPLHDLKGHFRNLLQELPFLLRGDDRTTCESIISAVSGDTMTGAKFRVCMIELYLGLKKNNIDCDILLLIESAIRISEILYMTEEDRNPRNILRLYNCTWLHHELCNNLITRFHGGMKYTTFFGTYLHALVAHAPQQLEIVSLRSVNTENQERVFDQARRSATAASNRHPQNVLYTAVLRLQAKAAFKSQVDAQEVADSIVAKAGGDVPKYSGTVISKSFIQTRERSWQSHLKRISHYLLHGKGTWWKETEAGYQFLDSDQDTPIHPEGPHLRHFRTTSLKEVTTSAKIAWDQVLAENIELPTTGIILYDQSGDPVNRQDNSMEENTTTDPSRTITENEPHQDEPIIAESNNGLITFDKQDELQEQTQANGEAEQEGDGEYFKTRHAMEIKKIIGSSTDLRQFDELRYRLKTTKAITRDERTTYKRLFYKLQLAVQRKRTSVLKEIEAIEGRYHQVHGTLPSEKDCPEFSTLMSQCKHINKLLHAWNIS